MTPDEVSALFVQHATLLQEIVNVYIALAVGAFIGLISLFCMFGASILSVRAVNQRQARLEGKFNLLIDALLQRQLADAAREKAAQTEKASG